MPTDELDNEPIKVPEVKKDSSKEMVSVPKDVLERMMDFMEKVPGQMERLAAVSDKSRLARYDMQNQKEIVRKVLLTTIDGKIVVAWKMLTNELTRDVSGRWHEDQTLQVVFESNDVKEIKYKPDFIGAVKIEVELVSLYTTPEGVEMARVALPSKEGEEARVLDICQTFLN